ncbi:hypothetical protein GCM10020360_10650 [Nonlabens tegetincola]
MPVTWSMRSASVDLPWSMCAMMQKLRIIEGSVDAGTGGFRLRGDIASHYLTREHLLGPHGQPSAEHAPIEAP